MMDMDIVAKYKLIRKLTSIIDDKASSEAEKDNAKARIIEIKNKLNEYLECLNKKRITKNRVNKRNVFIYNKDLNSRKSSVFFPVDLVFGWDKKVIVDVASIFDDVNKVVFLEWKCPCCGGHIERIITQKHRARLLRKPDGVGNFIDGIIKGDINQLCDCCYEKYR